MVLSKSTFPITARVARAVKLAIPWHIQRQQELSPVKWDRSWTTYYTLSDSTDSGSFSALQHQTSLSNYLSGMLPPSG